MCGKLIYSFSLVLSLSIPAYQTNASYPYLQDPSPDGIVSMEAENFDNNASGVFHTWTLVTSPAGASGSGAMQALPDARSNYRDPYGDNGYLALSPRLDFKVNFVKTGTHYVWVRGHANSDGGDGNADSCHVGLDNQAIATSDRITFNAAADWGWFNTTDRNPPNRATFDVLTAGAHTVNIWMREDGAIIDKIVLTTNPNYVPSGGGPEENTRVNPLFVDDFESYNENKKIFETWIPNSGTGAIIGHTTSPYVEQNIVHGGGKAMPYYYDNNRAGKAYYSEAEAYTSNLEIDPNWTREGVKALALHFYGKSNNAVNITERMYVALKDNANKMAVVYYDGDPNDVRDPNWHQWDIRLKDFNDVNGVNLNNVKKVYIGFGNRNHPTSGGSGLVYFDDIRLYPSRCVPTRAKPAGDLNNDCLVDYADLGIMTDNWLTDGQEADVYGDSCVTFGDFAILADSWLEELLWPQ